MTALPAMAASSTVSAPAQLCSTYSVTRRAVCAPSPHTSSWSCTISCPGTSKSLLPLRLSQLSLIRFSPWSGLKPLGTSLALSSRIERSKRRQRRMVVYASLFGVGAPEALVIGVVALLVFGPKGLAEIARNLGKTLRAFQPTIRELQEVSREFKSTLEREIGLDEIQERNAYRPNSTEPPTSSPPTIASNEQPQTVVDPNGAPSSGRAYSSEDNLRITEEQLKLSAAQQPQQQNSQTELSGEIPSDSKPQVEETAVTPPPPKSESGT